MRPLTRLHISLLVALVCIESAAGCTSSTPRSTPGSTSVGQPSQGSRQPSTPAVSSLPVQPATKTAGARKPGVFTMAFAGDVNFEGRTATRLARDPATAFGVAARGLRQADLTMVNLETAVTTGGMQQNKEFTFRAPPVAFTALRDAGVDVATMANNHGADYGAAGLRDSLAAIAAAHFPVVGIGADANAAYAPYRTTLNGVRVAIFAADQVNDETTLRLFSAGVHKAGVANAFHQQLLDEVRSAKRAGYVVVVYVHWGIEYQTCPSSDQRDLAAKLAAAGATAVVGTHAHVLQGAGWRSDATFVAYGLGNYLWWRSLGNQSDDNGVLTLTFDRDRVTGERFAPSHLDDTGVPVPATGAQKQRISDEFAGARSCADLASSPPK